jgi:hypothetical protein
VKDWTEKYKVGEYDYGVVEKEINDRCSKP